MNGSTNWIHLHCTGVDVFLDAARIYAVTADKDSDDGGSIINISDEPYVNVDENPQDVMKLMNVSVAAAKE